jgi:hypothetical protein
MTLTYGPAWVERVARYRREVANWCQLCEARTVRIWIFTLRVLLEVHHVYGKNGRSPVGYEADDELMTLCVPCHRRITTAHRALGRRRRQIDAWTRRTIDPAGYSQTIAEVTHRARPRYWARAWRRTLWGMP